MIPVSVQGIADAEAARVAGIDTGKGRKKDRRRAGNMAEEAARGALYGADGEPGEDGDDACKAYQDLGVHEGPGHLMQPGRIGPGEFHRPYGAEGHAAASPGHEPPREMPPAAPGAAPGTGALRHVDLTGSVALGAEITPHALAGPWEANTR